MNASDLATATWRKSSRSLPDKDECVELAAVAPAGRVAVRDSKNPTGPALGFRARGWSAFTTGVKHGRFER